MRGRRAECLFQNVTRTSKYVNVEVIDRMHSQYTCASNLGQCVTLSLASQNIYTMPYEIILCFERVSLLSFTKTWGGLSIKGCNKLKC